jgi:hypothetical protein
MARRKRDGEGRFTSGGWIESARERPWTSAVIAAGVAATGAFLWSRRSQIGEGVSSGMDRLSELKSQRMDWGSDATGAGGRSQSEISEEALTLKETGKRSKGPRGPIAQQDIKAGMATIE